MSFERNFKIMEEIPEPVPGLDQEVLAREIATSRPVVIHFLRERPGPEHSAFLRKLLRLGPEKNHYVLESGTLGSRPYIITRMLPENLSLREWAEGTETAPPVAPALTAVPKREPEPAAAPVEPAGEFTQLLQAPAASPNVVAPGPGPVPAAVKEAPSPPGEFTQLFQPETTSPPTRRFTPPPPGAGPAEPGEFTRLFQNSSPNPTTERYSTPPGATKSEPGEFTQLFQSANSPVTTERYAPPPPSSAPAEEFSQLFQTPKADPATVRFTPPPMAPAETSKPAQQPGEFTKVFKAGGQFPQLPQTPAAHPPPQFPGPYTPPGGIPPSTAGTALTGTTKTTPLFDLPHPRGPGAGEATVMFAAGAALAGTRPPSTDKTTEDDEFARKFGAAAVPLAAMKTPTLPAGTADAVKKAADKANPYMPLILGLGGLLLAVLLLIVFFAIKG